jgi:hypothetical protein
VQRADLRVQAAYVTEFQLRRAQQLICIPVGGRQRQRQTQHFRGSLHYGHKERRRAAYLL